MLTLKNVKTLHISSPHNNQRQMNDIDDISELSHYGENSAREEIID